MMMIAHYIEGNANQGGQAAGISSCKSSAQYSSTEHRATYLCLLRIYMPYTQNALHKHTHHTNTHDTLGFGVFFFSCVHAFYAPAVPTTRDNPSCHRGAAQLRSLTNEINLIRTTSSISASAAAGNKQRNGAMKKQMCRRFEHIMRLLVVAQLSRLRVVVVANGQADT